jgi:hypothetical protein
MLLILFLLCYKFQRHCVKLFHSFLTKNKETFSKEYKPPLFFVFHVNEFFLQSICLSSSLEGAIVATRFHRSFKTQFGAQKKKKKKLSLELLVRIPNSLIRRTLSSLYVWPEGQASAL